MQCILYGAGNIGKAYYEYLVSKSLEDCVFAFCDKNAKEINHCLRKEVIDFNSALDKQLPFVVAVNEHGEAFGEICSCLEAEGVTFYRNIFEYLEANYKLDRQACYRDYCALFHISAMDKYFDAAENDNALKVFWGEDTAFYKEFSKLDLSNVIELACGRGRHVDMYYKNADEITLVDVLEKNISICKERFRSYSNIKYYHNNGRDLSELPDEKYTAIFSYDAMVHFELIDIYNYLRESYRVLKPGSYALFHHSNDSSNYKNWFGDATNNHGRSFMDKNIFAYLAYRCGFEVIAQDIISWLQEDLDCLTLLYKK